MKFEWSYPTLTSRDKIASIYFIWNIKHRRTSTSVGFKANEFLHKPLLVMISRQDVWNTNADVPSLMVILLKCLQLIEMLETWNRDLHLNWIYLNNSAWQSCRDKQHINANNGRGTYKWMSPESETLVLPCPHLILSQPLWLIDFSKL